MDEYELPHPPYRQSPYEWIEWAISVCSFIVGILGIFSAILILQDLITGHAWQ